MSPAGGGDREDTGPEVRAGVAHGWPQESLCAWQAGSLKVKGGETGRATRTGCHRPGPCRPVLVINLFYVITMVKDEDDVEDDVYKILHFGTGTRKY